MLSSINVKRIHQLDYKVLIIIAILQPILTLALNYLFTIGIFNPLSTWSHHLINPTLQANFISLFIIGFIIFKIGKHNLTSIWFNIDKLKNGILLGIIFWMIIQTIVFLYLLFTETPMVLRQNISKEIGAILGQLFGNALNEELIFRGIFFLQFYLILRKRFSDRTAFLIALLASQLFFAVSHLPNRILIKHYENLILDQIKLFFVGILFVMFYIKSRNFVLTVIMHSLLNYQLRIFDVNFLYPVVTLVIFLLSITFWDQIKLKLVH